MKSPANFFRSAGTAFRGRLTPAAAVLAVMSVVMLVQLAAFPAGYVGKEHDDALYVLSSQSLADGGYRLWFLPGRPPNTISPPGLPALLLPAALLAPENLLGYQLLMFLLLLLADGALWLWLRRWFSPFTAASLTALAMLSPLVLARDGMVMPEIPFLLAALLVLLTWDRPGRAWVTGALLLAAYLVRPAALPLWAAVWLAMALRRRWADLAKASALPVLGYLLWRAWSLRGGGVQENLELAASYGNNFILNGLRVAAYNLERIPADMGASFLPLSSAGGAGAVVVGGVLLLFSLAGALRAVRQNPAEPAALFLIFSLAMHVFWPWWYFRYLVPLLPFLIWGAASLCRRGVWPAALACGLAVFQLFAQGRYWITPRPVPRPEAAAAYEWVRANTPPEMRLAALMYGREVLYTGRVVLPMPSGRSAVEFLSALRRAGVRYVLWQDPGDFGFSLPRSRAVYDIAGLRNMLGSSAGFVPVFHDPSSRVRIFELR